MRRSESSSGADPIPVLVVDDNAANAKLVAFVLSRQGFDVRTAADAGAAQGAIAERRPRLILMDLQLPGVDGFELTRRLKADPATRDIPVVIVTSKALDGPERARLAERAASVMSKQSVSSEVIDGIVRAALAGAGRREP